MRERVTQLTTDGPGQAAPTSDELAASPSHEAALHRALDAVPAMVGYWDANLRNVVANAAYLDFFGKAPGDFHGRHIRELLGDELYELNRPHIEAALAGEAQLFDREITDPNGVVRYTQASYIPDIVDGVVRGFSVLVTDITPRREAELAAKAAEARFRALFEMAAIGKFILDADGIVIDANRAAAEILRRPAESMIGSPARALVPKGDWDASKAALERVLDGDRIVMEEREYIRGDGTRVWAQLDATLVEDPSGGAPLIVSQIQDVSDRRRERSELAELATHDPLTALLNRRGLLDLLEETRRGAVVALDLDRFKRVNDELGHDAGDAVLVAVADILRARVRNDDAVARLGGDEFVLVLSHARRGDAERVAEDVVERIDAACLGLPDDPVSASVGVAVIEPGFAPKDLLARADAAMYSHKQRARRVRR